MKHESMPKSLTNYYYYYMFILPAVKLLINLLYQSSMNYEKLLLSIFHRYKVKCFNSRKQLY